jgi:hypothetical protein
LWPKPLFPSRVGAAEAAVPFSRRRGRPSLAKFPIAKHHSIDFYLIKEKVDEFWNGSIPP